MNFFVFKTGNRLAPWVDWYSAEASQDRMPLQWAQKVCIHGVIQ